MKILRDLTDDIVRSVAFLSRIPVPQRHFLDYDGRLNRAVRAFPLAGILIVLPPAALFSVLSALDVPALFSAFAVLTLQVLITGALHEDGLGDAADGIGGGRDRDTALVIMKDSRIGSYGAVAMVLSFGLRASALAGLFQVLTPSGCGLITLAVASLSRSAMVWHWSSLPPARKDGVAASAGEPDPSALRLALVLGAISGLLLVLLAGCGPIAAGLACLATVAATLGFTKIVRRKIGGHTGDTIGATQQVTEIAALTALVLVA